MTASLLCTSALHRTVCVHKLGAHSAILHEDAVGTTHHVRALLWKQSADELHDRLEIDCFFAEFVDHRCSSKMTLTSASFFNTSGDGVLSLNANTAIELACVREGVGVLAP